jgi:hypothetical protein
MDEIAVIRSFRSAIPERDDQARQRVRRLLRQRRPRPRFVRSRRVWIFAAAALAAVAAASSAFGWTSRLIDAIAGEPAPTPVKQAFAVHNEARARQVMRIFRRSPLGDVILEETHGVMGINTSVGPVIIWAAPTRGGGICWIVDVERMRRPDGVPNGGGGCNPTPLPPDVPLHYGVSGTRVGDRYLQLIEGRVSVGVASVELGFRDGRKEILPVFERFFLSELRGDSRPNLLIARDARGSEVDRRKMGDSPGMPSGIPGPEDIPKQVGPERVVIRLETSTGHPLTFSLAPAEGGQLCQITRYRGGLSRGCGPDRRSRVGPAELGIHPGLWNEAEDGKPLVSLNGVVGADIARLELRYSDGTVVPVPITERFVYFEIPPAHHEDARFVLIGRNRDRAEIARRVVK